jgi:hypothetical protein
MLLEVDSGEGDQPPALELGASGMASLISPMLADARDRQRGFAFASPDARVSVGTAGSGR